MGGLPWKTRIGQNGPSWSVRSKLRMSLSSSARRGVRRVQNFADSPAALPSSSSSGVSSTVVPQIIVDCPSTYGRHDPPEPARHERVLFSRKDLVEHVHDS